MAERELKNIFLSASIPLQERDPGYYETADTIAIRDAVIALATVAIPHCRLVWGGHPSITPVIYYVLQKTGVTVPEHVQLFQSDYFRDIFPESNARFHNVVYTEKRPTQIASLELMRREMLTSYPFSAGIFIGGMEGVEAEYELFSALHPHALLLPVASTGGAAKNIYDRQPEKEEELSTNYAYMSLFKNQLMDKIGIGHL